MLSVTSVTHRVDSGVGVYLQRVNVITGVLEQAVVRVQHLMRQQIEPLPAHGRTEVRQEMEGDKKRYQLHPAYCYSDSCQLKLMKE